jgi:predicted GNAT family N-acyltransferase
MLNLQQSDQIEKILQSIECPIGFHLTIATLEHTNSLKNLINEAYSDAHWFKQPHFYDRVNTASVMNYLNQEDTLFLILKEKSNENFSASIYIRLAKSRNELGGTSMLSVSLNHQKKGFGKFLFFTAQKIIVNLQRDFPVLVELEVVSVQEHLIKMYEKWGFEQKAIITWEDIGCSRQDVNQDCHLIQMTKLYTEAIN